MLKPKAETNSSFLVLHPSSGVHTVNTVRSHLNTMVPKVSLPYVAGSVTLKPDSVFRKKKYIEQPSESCEMQKGRFDDLSLALKTNLSEFEIAPTV